MEEIGNAWKNYRYFYVCRSVILEEHKLYAKEGEDTMRRFQEDQKTLSVVICNGCGRKLKVEGGILKEGCFEAKQVFGYFSSLDGKRQRFDLCEACYQKLLERLTIPAETEDITELL